MKTKKITSGHYEITTKIGTFIVERIDGLGEFSTYWQVVFGEFGAPGYFAESFDTKKQCLSFIQSMNNENK